MIKKCACGKQIKGRRDLCHECLEVFGTDKAEWPEWLRFMVADIKREYEYELRRDRDLEFDEERDSDNPEMDFEDYIWSNV